MGHLSARERNQLKRKAKAQARGREAAYVSREDEGPALKKQRSSKTVVTEQPQDGNKVTRQHLVASALDCVSISGVVICSPCRDCAFMWLWPHECVFWCSSLRAPVTIIAHLISDDVSEVAT